MTFIASSAVGYAWEAVGVFWLATLPFSKRTIRSQNWGSRLLHLALVSSGFVLLGTHYLHNGWLAARFASENRELQIAGFLLTLAGCGFAIWARLRLGANWSARAAVTANHELIVRGPYAITRHPIYSGLLLACFGTALVIGEWHCIVGTALVAVAFFLKMVQEERLMIETFPEAYPRYRRTVKSIIPGIF